MEDNKTERVGEGSTYPHVPVLRHQDVVDNGVGARVHAVGSHQESNKGASHVHALDIVEDPRCTGPHDHTSGTT